MPALNEERYIAAAIATLIPEQPSFEYELLVLDGGSTDATLRIVQLLATGNPRIRLVHNDKRVQSAAMNKAARMADPRSSTLLRADCHAHYPQGFIETCLREFEAHDCVSVVVPMKTVGSTCMQKAIASAQKIGRCERLLGFWGDKRLSDVTGWTCRAYAEHRGGQGAARRELRIFAPPSTITARRGFAASSWVSLYRRRARRGIVGSPGWKLRA
jgi:glycosyltransferase involved in cell wall biosynthesis